MTDERWHHIMRLVNEAFENSETRTVALRKRIVAGVKRKLHGPDDPTTDQAVGVNRMTSAGGRDDEGPSPGDRLRHTRLREHRGGMHLDVGLLHRHVPSDSRV